MREPIWLYHGQILDGRHRYRACDELGIECPVRQYDGDKPLAFIISMNFSRRHLTESQRAMIAAKIANMTRGGDRRSDQTANLQFDRVSRAKAAKLMNVSERTVNEASKLRKEAAPDVVEQIERGERSVHSALEEVEELRAILCQPDIDVSGVQELWLGSLPREGEVR